MEKNIKAISLLSLMLLLCSFARSQALEEIVLQKISRLDSIIRLAEKEGFDVTRERMAIRVAELAIKYANADEIPRNRAKNEECYAAHVDFKDNPQKAAADLPDFERQSAIEVLDSAFAQLQRVRKGELIRKPVPLIDYTKVKIEGGSLMQEGRPVFDADYVWRPDVPDINEYFGGAESEGLMLSNIQDIKGKPDAYEQKRLKNKKDQRIGKIWIGSSIPSWAKKRWPDIDVGGRLFGKFDIDHYGSREMFRLMFKAYVPTIADKRVTELGYDLHNEPSFFTKADCWNNADDNGICVSDSTREHFKTWLQQRHGDIAVLNGLWGTSFNGFNEVSVTLPMDTCKQGTPVWYDWMSFNNFRVTQWFTFLKSQIRKYDTDAKVRIKLMPWLWAENAKDHGVDFEALTELCDIIGPDMGARYYVRNINHEIYNTYSVDFRAALMTMDFFKSVRPNQIIYDSESHFLMHTKGFLPSDINLTYVRSLYWLAALHGLNATNTWVWARNEKGQIAKKASDGYIVDITHQPKALYTLTETFMDLNCFANEITQMQQKSKPIRIYYSKTSGINDATYMDKVFETYESVLFNGIPIGFVTQNILNDQSGWEVVLIRNTKSVTRAEFDAVQEYLNRGGNVLIDVVSFKEDEYGKAMPALKAGTGTLTIVPGLSEMRDKAVKTIEGAGLLPTINLTETNAIGKPGCIWRSIKNSEGKHVLSVMNVGKSKAEISLSLSSENEFIIRDLFTGNEVNSTLSLNPFETLFCVFETNDGEKE